METQSQTIDTEVLSEFYQDFQEAHLNCEQTLINLEHTPQDKELLNSLFRSIHTIKGNLIYVGLKQLTPLLQSIEDILDAIRHEQIRYDALLSDIVLVALDTTRGLVESALKQTTPTLSQSQIMEICQRISTLLETNEQQRQPAANQILHLLAPDTQLINPIESGQGSMEYSAQNAILHEHSISIDEDLLFFQKLSLPLEQRSHYWLGRTERLLRLTLNMNSAAGEPVQAAQLATAVYLHDVAMAFQPLHLLHKKSELDQQEIAALRSHPTQGSNLITGLLKWKEASQIILQHQERMDGSGYPSGLAGDEICQGARIMAIADSFDACSHERAYISASKRPFLRAILEINRYSGSLFDPSWVDIFNTVIKKESRYH